LVYEVINEVLDAERGTLLLEFVGACCQETEKGVKNKVCGGLVA
jgi:hypothetical protein